MRKCGNSSPYMRRPLAIYDFAPDPSEFPYIGGKFYFLFYQRVCEEYMYTTEYLTVRELLQPVGQEFTSKTAGKALS